MRLILILFFIIPNVITADTVQDVPADLKMGRSQLKTDFKVGVAPKNLKPKPFWLKKKKVFKRITDTREIVVSANVSKIKKAKNELYHFRIDAAGIVAAPLVVSSEIMWDIGNLSQVHDSFKEVKYYPKYQRAYVHLATLGFHAKMILQFEKKKNVGIDEMHWECVEGTFRGMKGVVRMSRHGFGKTLVSLDGAYESRALPLPKALMGFGLEVLARRVAISLREHMEKGGS